MRVWFVVEWPDQNVCVSLSTVNDCNMCCLCVGVYTRAPVCVGFVFTEPPECVCVSVDVDYSMCACVCASVSV